MPKRPCPFEDDLPPQLKVHVGQKQVDNGVSREERMKNVYGKTLHLLKEGVKTLSQKLNSSLEINQLDIPVAKQPLSFKYTNDRNTKQMILNNSLQLVAGKKSVKDTRPQYDFCDCSQVIDQNTPSRCSYCDQILCSYCLSKCAKCLELFCQACSLPAYDHEEHNLCLNCYR